MNKWSQVEWDNVVRWNEVEYGGIWGSIVEYGGVWWSVHDQHDKFLRVDKD